MSEQLYDASLNDVLRQMEDDLESASWQQQNFPIPFGWRCDTAADSSAAAVRNSLSQLAPIHYVPLTSQQRHLNSQAARLFVTADTGSKLADRAQQAKLTNSRAAARLLIPSLEERQRVLKVQSLMGLTDSQHRALDISKPIVRLDATMDLLHRVADGSHPASQLQALVPFIQQQTEALGSVMAIRFPSYNTLFMDSSSEPHSNQLGSQVSVDNLWSAGNMFFDELSQATLPGANTTPPTHATPLLSANWSPWFLAAASNAAKSEPSLAATVTGCASANVIVDMYNIPETFPAKLYRMLDEVEAASDHSVISFDPSGKSFKVHDPAAFLKRIAPRYFRQGKIRSFKRQLNNYMFRKVLSGPNEGSYAHPYFQRGHQDQLYRIQRVRTKKRKKQVPDKVATDCMLSATD